MTRLITTSTIFRRATVFLLATILLLATAVNPAAAATKLEQRVDAATAVLTKFTQIPEQGIPPTLLSNAHAIAVVPGLIKAGFWIGGSYGKGILVVRRDDGRWSNPTFISIGAGSFGPQIGAQSTDIVLVFKSRKSVDNIANGQFQLGGDASVAAGPVGRQTSASTDLRLKAEVYSYARSRGLFAGISLEGAMISMDNKSNFAFYQDGQSTADNILSDTHRPAPAHARRFIETLSAKAPRLSAQGSRTADSNSMRDVAEPTRPQNDVKTYGINEAPSPDDTVF
jgi:lipid-binding SYLF domain-containing protein